MTAAEGPITAAPPEMNQLVHIRGRTWVVGEVLPSSLPPDPLSGPPRLQHLVSLTSVDDAPEDELSVIWEIEPGARIMIRETLPDPSSAPFDPPDRLDAFLDAVRWGAVTSADATAVQAPFRSGITIEDYQLDPLVRALSMPRVNLLIADDVGLGKTIEAGLVLQELLLRHRARTVLVVCPATLCAKWQREMRERFGLEFRIVDAALVRSLRRERGLAANPWTHFPRLITSMDWVKTPRALSLFRDVLPPGPHSYPRAFDLLIIDEVHHVAPAGRGAYAVESQRTRAIRELSPHFEHHLHLSATPHNGYTESWTALLEMLDSQRFARGVEPPPEALRRIMVRRLKSELREDPELRRPDGSPRFAARRVCELEVEYPDHERDIHSMLQRYTEMRRLVGGGDTLNRQAADFVAILLKKRLFSSPAAFANTLGVHRATLETSASARRAGASQLHLAFARLDEEIADEAEHSEATEEALAAAAAVARAVGREEGELLSRMAAWAEAWRHRPDAKATRLLAFLDEVCRPQGTAGRRWNDERIIVFTEYRDTQLYLHDLLARRLPQGEIGSRVALLYGGMDEDRRERIKTEFQAHPSRAPVRILLATDAASEGIDLQLHCHRLVHMEVPFNPARMEQRNGRVDRHGQTAPEVLIHHFVSADYRQAAPGSLDDDLQFLSRLAHKLETAREDLGTVAPLLSEQVERRMLGDERATVDVTPRPQRRPAVRLARLDRSLREDVSRLAARLLQSRDELGITPATVERVVRIGLELAREAPLAPATLRRSPDDRRPPGPAFRVGRLTGSWARTVLDLPDPLSQELRPITFDHAVAEEADDVVLAHLGHPLVTHAMRLLSGRMWSTVGEAGLSRVTARLVPDAVLAHLAIAVHCRLVITGHRGHRLHEEVIAAGGRIAAGRFSREGYGPDRLAELAQAATTDVPDPHVCEAMARAWSDWETQVRDAVRARAGERAGSLDSRLDSRMEGDVATLREVLQDLRRSITAELEQLSKPEQMVLSYSDFSEEERRQLRSDVDALRARVERIPAEMEQEEAGIRARYGNRSVRIFPAAITFYVPRRLARSGIETALGDSRG